MTQINSRGAVQSLRPVQLCAKHSSGRDGLYRQAAKKSKTLVEQLDSMPKQELLEHIANFTDTLLCLTGRV